MRPVMLVILDGFGLRAETADNAVALARTPHFDRLWAACPHAELRTSGLDVGLPPGQMGNSEVGHLNIGAGRVVMQDLPRIDAAIEDGSFLLAPALQRLIAALKRSKGTCHMLGLVSEGGVHAHQGHIQGLARALAAARIPTVIHAITDGRDVAPRSADTALAKLTASLPKGVTIGTVSGRYYAMDRDKRWERVGLAYAAMAAGQGPRFPDAASAIAAGYAQDVTDEFVVPACIGEYAGMKPGDGILCANFRADRVREILTALLDPAFDGFARDSVKFAATAGMADYGAALRPLIAPIFPPIPMHDLLGETVARAGLTQARLAETEKYPHVTYFLNGGSEVPLAGESQVMVPSPKVATYDLQPEMSAPELTARAVALIESGDADLLILNFANADMVGHTGMLDAAIRAVETVDAGLGRIADAIERAGGALLVTADHGNAELMRDPETGGPHTAHTTNPVPVFLMGPTSTLQGIALHDGRLADVAPTLLALLGVPQPGAMTGRCLYGA